MNPPPQLHFGPPAVHSDLRRRHSPRRSLASSLSDLGVKSLKSFSFPFFCLQAKSLSSKSFVFCNAHPLFSHFFTLAEISPLFTYSSQKHPGYTPGPPPNRNYSSRPRIQRRHKPESGHLLARPNRCLRRLLQRHNSTIVGCANPTARTN